MVEHSNVAIIGAAGACGRQLAVALLERRMLPRTATLQLVGHRGGASETALHGLRADLRDAFADHAPTIELVYEPAALNADLVVVLAGAAVSTAPGAKADRLALGRINHGMFADFANELAGRSGPAPLVLVQSSPVELGVEMFSRAISRHRVIGIGAYSDTLRFRRELADSYGVDRSQVSALVLGQHGGYLVPVWSSIQIEGFSVEQLDAVISEHRVGRSLVDLPLEIAQELENLLALIRAQRVHEAFSHIAKLPPDLRAAVKPFVTHFTAGHTTEIATAHSVAEVMAVLLDGRTEVMPLQVRLEGEFHGLHGVTAVPVRVNSNGWAEVVDPNLAPDELDLLQRAVAHVASANAVLLESA